MEEADKVKVKAKSRRGRWEVGGMVGCGGEEETARAKQNARWGGEANSLMFSI